MATTTATLQLQSSDLTGDVLSLNQSSTLRKAGVSTGLDQTTGVGRKTTTSTSEYTLFDAADYTDSKAHKLYVRVVSSNATEFVTLPLAALLLAGCMGVTLPLFLGWGTQTSILHLVFLLNWFLSTS